MSEGLLTEPHYLANSPNEAWKELQRTGSVCRKIDLFPTDSNIPRPHIKCVCISDTHGKLEEYLPNIPDGDLLICAGDFTNHGLPEEIEKFNCDLAKLPHKTKLVVAGNHEKTFRAPRHRQNKNTTTGPNGANGNISDSLRGCIYLADETVEIGGYKFYGTPWMPDYPKRDFGLPRGRELMEKRNSIPSDTHVLITHTPPLGHGDSACDTSRLGEWIPFFPQLGYHLGDVDLLRTIEGRVKPKYHVFGHVHKAHGVTTNGETIFINASACRRSIINDPTQDPVVFYLPCIQ